MCRQAEAESLVSSPTSLESRVKVPTEKRAVPSTTGLPTAQPDPGDRGGSDPLTCLRVKKSRAENKYLELGMQLLACTRPWVKHTHQ